MKTLISMSLCLLLLAAGSTAAIGQESDEGKQEEAENGLIEQYQRFRHSYKPEAQERLSLFSQSLETMARNLDPLERMSNELEVDGFEEMAQAAEAFLKTAKPFVDRLADAAKKQSSTSIWPEAIHESALKAFESQLIDSKENPEVQEPGTEKKAIMSPRMTGDPAVDERIRAALLVSMQKAQQEAMMKAAMEYYAAQQLAAQTEAKEEIGLFQEVVGNEATARITGIEDRLSKLETLLEKILTKMDDKQK